MKYKEFEKLMEDEGFEVHFTITDVFVEHKYKTVAVVSKEDIGLIDLNCTQYDNLPVETRKFIADNCMELTFTDLEDREEVEKYYLRQKGVGSWSFLNFNIDTQGYIVAGKKVNYTYKTQFTQSEIDDMPECYTHPAVWEKIKVESEEQ